MIRQVVKAGVFKLGGFVYYQSLPDAQIDCNDPFLLLHHQTVAPVSLQEAYPGWFCTHKTRESITIICEANESPSGNVMVYREGVQWIHTGSRMRETGAGLFIIQLDLLEARAIRQPLARGRRGKQASCVLLTGETAIHVVSGQWQGIRGIEADVHLALLHMKQHSSIGLQVEDDRNVIVYVIRGAVHINQKHITGTHLALLNNDGEEINIEAEEDTEILIGHALPTGHRSYFSPALVNSEAAGFV
jgi:redox-sensitive bicupin YhaK (pirin superfamily)